MAGRPNLGPGFEANTLSLAVYAALCMKPMTRGELRRLMYTGYGPLGRALQRLVDNNIVVKQSDKRYRVVVTLMLPKTPQGTVPLLTPSTAEAAAPRALKRADREAAAVLEDAPSLRPVIVPQSHVTVISASERAKMLGARMKMPPSNTLGELSTGPLGKCGCGTSTPFRYGKVVMCPVCARK